MTGSEWFVLGLFVGLILGNSILMGWLSRRP
jgi:hypothetical protein